ncbi:hypothetical protein EDD85DRAFT_955765 [Armillaria nabsnona]|nr:hypothetical protein EDD85DRAFT_955765 [Armillaria nabsnona]
MLRQPLPRNRHHLNTSSLVTLVSTCPTRSIQSWIIRYVNTDEYSYHVPTIASQNRVGSKFGGGDVAGASETNVDRRERLRKLALETIDLAKDPYILRNHLGSLECRLCLTLHTNEGSYLAHT